MNITRTNNAVNKLGFTMMELVVATAILFTILVVFVKLGAWVVSLISW
jgi:type II secretory pathway component PulJ